jgi:hypothetical protein
MGVNAGQEAGPEGMGQLPTQAQRPEKRRVFLGRFAPAFFDEANLHQVYGHDRANAVVENITGLMLCYDELWFLRRDFCPMDMQGLDFVKFVSDDADMAKTAEGVFREQQDSVRRKYNEWTDDVRRPYLYSAARVGDLAEYDARLESEVRLGHAQYRGQSQRLRYLHHHLTAVMDRAGHTTTLRPRTDYEAISQRVQAPDDQLSTGAQVLHRARQLADLDQIAEWFVADALQLGPVDCIANTGSAILLPLPEGDTDDGVEFEAHKVEAIEEILHLRSIDALGPRGAYQDFIPDLRNDRRMQALRAFLAGRPSPDGTAASLAAEVEKLIEECQRECRRRDRRPRAAVRALGSEALGAVTGTILGGAATAHTGSASFTFAASVLSSLVGARVGDPLKIIRGISENRFHKENQLAMFVIDARDRVSEQSPGQ